MNFFNLWALRVAYDPICPREVRNKLEYHKWGLRDGGSSNFPRISEKKAFFLRFLDFPGALETLWKRAKKVEDGRKKAGKGRFPGRAARHHLNPHFP